MGNEAGKPSIITSSLDFLVNWGRTNSLWPFPYGTACCAIEFMSTEVGRYDLSRIGSEYVRFTPRQSDVLLVAGTITYKQAPILKRIYEQMAELSAAAPLVRKRSSTRCSTFRRRSRTNPT